MLLKVGEEVVYRVIGKELVVILSESGEMYHFAPATEAILKFFQNGASLEQLIKGMNAAGPAKDNAEKLVALLAETKILVPTATLTDAPPPSKVTLPQIGTQSLFIRKNEKSLDELTVAAFVCGDG